MVTLSISSPLFPPFSLVSLLAPLFDRWHAFILMEIMHDHLNPRTLIPNSFPYPYSSSYNFISIYSSALPQQHPPSPLHQNWCHRGSALLQVLEYFNDILSIGGTANYLPIQGFPCQAGHHKAKPEGLRLLLSEVIVKCRMFADSNVWLETEIVPGFK